jgi:DNA-binding SARP family transcriptional activator/TolB-like protein/tetratricopeptide (TPR) repeat protein
VRLRTLGGLSVDSITANEGAATRRRPLALLALLAVAGSRGVSRDKIVAYLWPESDDERARNSLSQALRSLKRELGVDPLVLGSAELRLNEKLITSDVQEFGHLLERGETERAVELYKGPFLDGVFVKEAPEFERWVQRERDRLHRLYLAALDRLGGNAQAAGDYVAAVRWRRERTAVEPLDSRAALALMQALVTSGDSAGALQHFRRHADQLHEELGIEPEPDVSSFAASLRAGSGPRTARSSQPNAALRDELPVAADTAAPTDMAGRSSASVDAGRIPRVADPGEGDGPAIDSRPQSGTLRSRSRSSTSLVIGGLGVAVALALVVALGLHRRGGTNERATPPQLDSSATHTAPLRRVQRLAVLPLSTAGSDSIARLVADGVTGEMISALTRAGIVVIGYRSVSAYTSSDVSLQEVGRALTVDAVATGSLARRERTVELSLKVANPRTAEIVWAQSITADSADISRLASAAAGSLAGWILGGDAGSRGRLPAKAPITSPEAYTRYLLGMRAAARATAVAMKQSLDLLESAIVMDSNFAEAHAGLGMALTMAIDYGILPGDEAFRRAAPIIARSIALDSTLAMAHLARARLLQLRDWNWKGAEAEYLKAIDLEPNALSFQTYGWFLEWYVGRAEEGVAMGQRAVEIDPEAASPRVALGWRLRGADQLEPAAREAHIALGLDSAAIDAYWILAEVFLRRGDYREAEKYARRYIEAGGDVPANSTTLGEILARSGRVAEATAYAARLSLLARRDGPSLVALARTEMALGRQERALSLLERAVRERVFTIPFQPYWDPIRHTPRFRALMRAQGLE